MEGVGEPGGARLTILSSQGTSDKVWSSSRPQRWQNRADRAHQQRRCSTWARGHHPFGAQARTTFTETPCRCGRNVALLSASKTKLPPGLIA